MRKKPLVSIIIVNYNGSKYIGDCLSSIRKSLYRQYEIIVVDQASTDGSADLVCNKFPEVLLVRNRNTGYAGGNNLGAENAKGKYLFLLNADTVMESDLINSLVEAMEKDPKIGCCQPKAFNLKFKNRLDGAGSLLTVTGFLYHMGYFDQDKPEYNKRYPVFSVKGAYLMTKKDLFDRLGGLDENFFMYFEESDYCGRVWLSGYSVEYIPDSVIYHWGGESQNWNKNFPKIQYQIFRNRICSYIKNLSASNLIKILSLHILLCEGMSLIYLLIGKWQVSIAIQRAIFWNIANLYKTLKKRKTIQKNIRKVDDSHIFSRVGRNVDFIYYYNNFKILNGKKY